MYEEKRAWKLTKKGQYDKLGLNFERREADRPVDRATKSGREGVHITGGSKPASSRWPRRGSP